ncbi:MAG: transglutaminase family protein [Parachlamydiaceae bacterium]
MSIKVSLNHKTHYVFGKDVSLSPHLVRLKPAPHTRIPIEAYSLKITPNNYFINWQQDPFGNHVARLVFKGMTDFLSVEVDLIANLKVINPFDFFVEEYAKNFPFEYPSSLTEELSIYLKKEVKGPLFQTWLNDLDKAAITTIDYLSSLNQQVHKAIRYSVRLEPGVQSCEETLRLGTGSCRDMAWLLLQTLRAKGIAARFVSGYLIQLKSSGYLSQDVAELPQDLSDLHAWVEAYLPGAGWIGLDPTAGLFASEGHIPLCCAPEPNGAAPIVGSTSVCDVKFDFSTSVTRLDPNPPLTHADPYSTEEWQEIDSLGKQIDEELREQQITLTFGGEPTFVSMDHQNDEEWSVKAVGEHKFAIANDLIKRLMSRTTTGGLLVHSQGKWYPGEELPRWALGCYWRKDFVPLWKDASLFADISTQNRSTIKQAQTFITRLAEKLNVDSHHILPAYEDEHWEQLLATSDLPTSPHPIRPPIGYVLPFQGLPWSFKRKYLFLIPGTSSMGYRLPLKQVQTEKKVATPTALCIELRQGILYLFIPPIDAFEIYYELIQHIETIASALKCQILIEGYPPPADPNVASFQITPDPGVIEVNVYPSHNWEELKTTILIVYEEAKNARLTTEKYLIDGRRIGAGGGHHMIIGGPTPPQSPILQRPDLLQSFLTYWQHHPCFSYFFSGLFIGPTSQAPRIDEARHETLYELEIAFSQLPRLDKNDHTQIDRLFRHLLVDVTGNTHRSEICIDKLYAPHTNYGKQGLLEFRSFEMQPHPHMSLLQILLIRAFVAYFWKTPYQHRFTRWGTELHDRMLLPYFLWQDLGDVLIELNSAGFKFKKEWFMPFFEFRFPIYGQAQFENIHLELRMALEPWNVLEEGHFNHHTSRIVDSSTQRVQIKMSGILPHRHIITCNKRYVPLHPCPEKGEYIAGIRYKAWNPPLTLHPLIPVNTPLVIDVYDTWLKRSIGGVTYHSTHPGGLNYVHLPVNAKEAEARRNSRFEVFGHTYGTQTPPVKHRNQDYPYTLDLRRPE